jgi:glycosyltransferase involved in cell wall biosynthesis
MMKVGIAHEPERHKRPMSIQIYIDAIIEQMNGTGFSFFDVDSKDTEVPADLDMLWAPALGLRRTPRIIETAGLPVVATVHGLQRLTDWPRFWSGSPRAALGHWRWRIMIRLDWRRLRRHIDAVVAVSDASGRDIINKLAPKCPVKTAYHGVRRDLFWPDDGPRHGVLHISQYSSSKNVEKILAAWEVVQAETDETLEIISIGAPAMRLPPRCTLSREPISHAEVAARLRRARIFAFPSLDEPFGMPVLEAMASGTPVLTSIGTGAAEIAGNAALLVEPNDVGAVTQGLRSLVLDPALRNKLSALGLKQAERFTWAESAYRHQEIFTAAIRHRRERLR